jgi:hypothetical protein
MHPEAVVLAQADAQGNLVDTKIIAEPPPNAGWGPLLVKGFQGAKFTPALSNSRRGPGQFNLIANYEKMFNPDSGPAISTHINRDDTNR